MSLDKLPIEVIENILKFCWTDADRCRLSLTQKRIYSIYKYAESRLIASIIDFPTVERNFECAMRALNPKFDLEEFKRIVAKYDIRLADLHNFAKTKTLYICYYYSRIVMESLYQCVVPAKVKFLDTPDTTDNIFYGPNKIERSFTLEPFFKEHNINRKIAIMYKFMNIEDYVLYMKHDIRNTFMFKSNNTIYYKVSKAVYLMYDKYYNKVYILYIDYNYFNDKYNYLVSVELKLSRSANRRRVFMYHIRLCEYLYSNSASYNHYTKMSDELFCNTLFPESIKSFVHRNHITSSPSWSYIISNIIAILYFNYRFILVQYKRRLAEIFENTGRVIKRIGFH